MKGRADDAGPQDYEPTISPLVESVLALFEEAGWALDLVLGKA